MKMIAEDVAKELGKKVKETITFAEKGTFTSISMAQKVAKEMGFVVGSMCHNEPMGLAPAEKYGFIAKWYNIDHSDKKKLSGVIISPDGDFREGSAQIVIFAYGNEMDDEDEEDVSFRRVWGALCSPFIAPYFIALLLIIALK
jgi:hypothetical protein